MTSAFKIHQVRLGLATNSSSTHSIIILPGGATDNGIDGGFGWDHFTAASEAAKGLYAAIQLRDSLEQMVSDEIAHTVAQAWTGVDLAEPGTYDHYVDHQSRWTLPCSWDENGIDRAFFDDLRAFIMRPDVVVLGGNDNEDERHPLEGREDATRVNIGVPKESSSKGLVARKDPEGGYWVLFNRNTGTKVRVSFGEGDLVKPTKAHAPELVDLKITDWCGAGCEFCYQDSTKSGVHGEASFITDVISALGKLKVFEVAIGGGEPTAHPRFVEILQACRYHGIVPNFTTKAKAWLHDHKRRQAILEHTGAFAFSIDHAQDLEEIASARDVYGIPNTKVNCQLVMGLVDEYQFRAALEAAAARRMRLTLLGYKTNGRGSKVKPKDYSGWVGVLKKVYEESTYGLSIGIDTALAQEYQGQLEAAGVPGWCYEVREGAFSMYIDAVTKKTARSSYGEALAMRAIKNKGFNVADEIAEHFAGY